MNKFIKFCITLTKKIQKDGIFSLSNEVTYKLILSMFPFLIFLLSLLGSLNIDIQNLIDAAKSNIPDDVLNMVIAFINEVFSKRHPSLMSFSVLVTLYSSSGGFRAVIRGINRSFSQEDNRGFLINTILSIAFIFLFAAAIICSLICLIYGDLIINFLNECFVFSIYINKFFQILIFLSVILLIFLTVCIIYKFALTKKVNFRTIVPGAIFTVVFWLISSKIYNIYIEKYANYSKIYGSIGGLFILLIWLNLISNLLLIGSEINSIFHSIKQKNNIQKKFGKHNFDNL